MQVQIVFGLPAQADAQARVTRIVRGRLIGRRLLLGGRIGFGRVLRRGRLGLLFFLDGWIRR